MEENKNIKDINEIRNILEDAASRDVQVTTEIKAEFKVPELDSQFEMREPDFERGAEILRKYKAENQERFAGKRCFIIGNGPSLKPEDLDKIKDEFSIGCNRIYLIFKDTEWRPNIFTSTDRKIIQISVPEMSELKAELKIIATSPNNKVYPIDGTIDIRAVSNANNWLYEGKLPPFSDDITECVYHGMSISYTNIQIAAWLGFKEIILMGMDHQYRRHWHVLTPTVSALLADQLRDKPGLHGRILENKNIERDHFCEGYGKGRVSAKGDEISDYCVDEVTRAFMSARKYAEAHGIKILNATRGGKLDIFERVNFDKLINKIKLNLNNKNAEIKVEKSAASSLNSKQFRNKKFKGRK